MLLSSFFVFAVAKFCMADTLSGSGAWMPEPAICPRNFIWGRANSHFLKVSSHVHTKWAIFSVFPPQLYHLFSFFFWSLYFWFCLFSKFHRIFSMHPFPVLQCLFSRLLSFFMLHIRMLRYFLQWYFKFCTFLFLWFLHSTKYYSIF